MSCHLLITGARAADRIRTALAEEPTAVVARCHRRLRGPYTGVDTLLHAVLPDAARSYPQLVEDHRVELLYGIPELEAIIGPAPSTLAAEASQRERTRFYGSGMIRCMSQGIVTFLTEYARRTRAARHTTTVVVFDEIDQAEPTTQEFAALLMRRADPAVLRVLAGSSGPSAAVGVAELRRVLGDHAQTRPAAATQAPTPTRDRAQLVADYIAADCAGDDPAELEAYRTADPELVRRLHDERAEQLEADASWGVRVGALAFHREHGRDPGGAGRQALLAALNFCVTTGFSESIVDLGMRGRAVTDPVAEHKDFCRFTNQAASALVPLGRLEESLALYLELRRRYTAPTVHMTTAYAIAMLYTRFFVPRDHELALAYQNTAIAIAGLLPDPADRLVFGVFQDNALALIEMHRRNLDHALDLVQGGIARLDASLAPDEWVLHRSQLLYNRARLQAALGRLDEAYADYSTLIEIDPYYTDYLSERAKVSRSRGEFDAALADYDRAVRLAPPFPELYFNRGTARAAVGDVEGALADFAYVLEMEPDDLETRLARAELLLDTGAVDAAGLDVEAGLALRPDEPRLVCMRGTVLVQQQDWAAALAAFDTVLDAERSYPAALVNRAVAYVELGRPDEAVDDLTAAIEAVGEDPDLLLNRGIAHDATGRPDLAVADYDRALGLPGADTAELRERRAVSERRSRLGQPAVAG